VIGEKQKKQTWMFAGGRKSETKYLLPAVNPFPASSALAGAVRNSGSFLVR
jgi:hypothetical protein